MKIKIFKCGLCKPEKRIELTRNGFRKHLAEEHRIMSNKFNTSSKSLTGERAKGKKRQNWVIEVTDNE